MHRKEPKQRKEKKSKKSRKAEPKQRGGSTRLKLASKQEIKASGLGNQARRPLEKSRKAEPAGEKRGALANP